VDKWRQAALCPLRFLRNVRQRMKKFRELMIKDSCLLFQKSQTLCYSTTQVSLLTNASCVEAAPGCSTFIP
jgi:hypothetical protein